MASTSKDSQATIAKKTWELENNIKTVNTVDEIYKYDKQQQQDILRTKPWEKDPCYFKDIKISALALLKMVMHARSGGILEIMGLLLGKVEGNTMIVMDSFALPVEGTETRVNAQAQAYEYMTAYIESAKVVGRLENAIGWYHSHPGYGCWLSGIDVSTQMLNQNFQDPFVAIVIDPVRTISAGKVCLGAFRTYPKGYKPANDVPTEYQTIPLNKIDDFGVHCNQYYSLEVNYFKSSLDRRLLDLLWNKYWVNTLSSSSLITNADYLTGQINDLSDKLEQAALSIGRVIFDPVDRPKADDKMAKATKDSNKNTIEIMCGLMSETIKEFLFNSIPKNN
ncbi:COP9 signalosome complex subunit 5-like [Adelges cooleyi]|uniref:COP9 signalosome complex subunit 5-like n=1 Tax=Adelges cooleyi TaxID=133065 RepID=UPI0021805060|nr:COP9 signalosome complex subunit 5-like [Adelges cooleyi]XP_050438969.1 COP9 signalosome complex subunit 5-like [Adelges cooleyi]XP_050438970.1 COP9 signalosome complex subunit 5-like [Adelges cooleyi]XP_050438971.1 COP9 signalosome complex subunit 5-like [Adelges cooleyi]